LGLTTQLIKSVVEKDEKSKNDEHEFVVITVRGFNRDFFSFSVPLKGAGAKTRDFGYFSLQHF